LAGVGALSNISSTSTGVAEMAGQWLKWLKWPFFRKKIIFIFNFLPFYFCIFNDFFFSL